MEWFWVLRDKRQDAVTRQQRAAFTALTVRGIANLRSAFTKTGQVPIFRSTRQ